MSRTDPARGGFNRPETTKRGSWPYFGQNTRFVPKAAG